MSENSQQVPACVSPLFPQVKERATNLIIEHGMDTHEAWADALLEAFHRVINQRLQPSQN